MVNRVLAKEISYTNDYYFSTDKGISSNKKIKDFLIGFCLPFLMPIIFYIRMIAFDYFPTGRYTDLFHANLCRFRHRFIFVFNNLWSGKEKKISCNWSNICISSAIFNIWRLFRYSQYCIRGFSLGKHANNR